MATLYSDLANLSESITQDTALANRSVPQYDRQRVRPVRVGYVTTGAEVATDVLHLFAIEQGEEVDPNFKVAGEALGTTATMSVGLKPYDAYTTAAWVPLTRLLKGNFVTDSGSTYLALKDYTTSAAVATDITNGNLIKILDATILSAALDVHAAANTASSGGGSQLTPFIAPIRMWVYATFATLSTVTASKKIVFRFSVKTST